MKRTTKLVAWLFRWSAVEQFGNRNGRCSLINRLCIVYDLFILDMGIEQTSHEENALWLVSSRGRWRWKHFAFSKSFLLSISSFLTHTHTRRCSQVIGALTSVLLIWVVTGILFYLAVERIINKTFELNSTVMLITSAVGVAVNLVLVIHYIQSKQSIASTKRVWYSF